MLDIIISVLKSNAGTKILSSSRAVLTGTGMYFLTPLVVTNPALAVGGMILLIGIYTASEVVLKIKGKR